MGNGLKHEFKDCKDGILYNRPGYDIILSVKTKLLSEEAVLTSKNKQYLPAKKQYLPLYPVKTMSSFSMRLS